MFTPVANLLLCGWIVSTTGKFTRNIKGPSNMLSRNGCYGLRPLLTALVERTFFQSRSQSFKWRCQSATCTSILWSKWSKFKPWPVLLCRVLGGDTSLLQCLFLFISYPADTIHSLFCQHLSTVQWFTHWRALFTLKTNIMLPRPAFKN